MDMDTEKHQNPKIVGLGHGIYIYIVQDLQYLHIPLHRCQA